MDTTECANELTRLKQKRAALHDEWSKLLDKRVTLSYGTPEYDACRTRYEEVSTEMASIDGQISRLLTDWLAYKPKPKFTITATASRLRRFFKKALLPLPADTESLHWESDPSPDDSQRKRAAILLVGVTVFTFAATMVDTRMFTAALPTYYPVSTAIPMTWDRLIMALVMLLGVVTLYVKRRDLSSGIRYAALGKEQRFRMGSESWPAMKRVWACIVSALMSFFCLFLPIATLLALVAVSGVYTWLYLREYRRTGDSVGATFKTARLRATFNRYGIYLVATGVAVHSFAVIISFCAIVFS